MPTEAVADVRPAIQPATTPSAPPTPRSVAVRIGSRFSFEAVPWAVCFAAALAALRARVFLADMSNPYPAPLPRYTNCDTDKPSRSEIALGGAYSSQSLLK